MLKLAQSAVGIIADISELTAKINIPEGQISNIAVGGLSILLCPHILMINSAV